MKPVDTSNHLDRLKYTVTIYKQKPERKWGYTKVKLVIRSRMLISVTLSLKDIHLIGIEDYLWKFKY